jgi:hypothetical protein
MEWYTRGVPQNIASVAIAMGKEASHNYSRIIPYTANLVTKYPLLKWPTDIKKIETWAQNQFHFSAIYPNRQIVRSAALSSDATDTTDTSADTTDTSVESAANLPKDMLDAFFQELETNDPTILQPTSVATIPCGIFIHSEKNIFDLSGVFPNRGTLAGGANTTLYGHEFERKTDPTSFLVQNGFIPIQQQQQPTILNKKYKNGLVFRSDADAETIWYLPQTTFCRYMKDRFGVASYRRPDEAYLIERNTGETILRILEKKEQRVDGSVEDKLLGGGGVKFGYECMMKRADISIRVEYAYCVNTFLENKLNSDVSKYVDMRAFHQQEKILVLYGDHPTYHESLYAWIKSL